MHKATNIFVFACAYKQAELIGLPQPTEPQTGFDMYASEMLEEHRGGTGTGPQFYRRFAKLIVASESGAMAVVL